MAREKVHARTDYKMALTRCRPVRNASSIYGPMWATQKSKIGPIADCLVLDDWFPLADISPAKKVRHIPHLIAVFFKTEATRWHPPKFLPVDNSQAGPAGFALPRSEPVYALASQGHR